MLGHFFLDNYKSLGFLESARKIKIINKTKNGVIIKIYLGITAFLVLCQNCVPSHRIYTGISVYMESTYHGISQIKYEVELVYHLILVQKSLLLMNLHRNCEFLTSPTLVPLLGLSVLHYLRLHNYPDLNNLNINVSIKHYSDD